MVPCLFYYVHHDFHIDDRWTFSENRENFVSNFKQHLFRILSPFFQVSFFSTYKKITINFSKRIKSGKIIIEFFDVSQIYAILLFRHDTKPLLQGICMFFSKPKMNILFRRYIGSHLMQFLQKSNKI